MLFVYVEKLANLGGYMAAKRDLRVRTQMYMHRLNRKPEYWIYGWDSYTLCDDDAYRLLVWSSTRNNIYTLRRDRSDMRLHGLDHVFRLRRKASKFRRMLLWLNQKL